MLKSTIVPLNISDTVRDRGMVPKDHQWPMVCRMVTCSMICPRP